MTVPNAATACPNLDLVLPRSAARPLYQTESAPNSVWVMFGTPAVVWGNLGRHGV
jgi:hypothetical protein